MKIKITLTMLLAVIAVAMMAASAFSQTFTISRHMGTALNTAVNESNSTMAPNGLSLYFSSTRTDLGGLGGNDIYVSRRATLGSVWGAPQNLGATVNTSSTEHISSISRDGLTMFLFSNRPGGLGGNDIYFSTRTGAFNDFGWTAPINLGSPINTELDDGLAAYVEDEDFGNSLIFSSNRNNGGVDYDLFQSTRNANGTFNTPVAIDELNTPGAELRPAVRRDGLEIYFGAARFGGLGELGTFDIWISKRASTFLPWNPPVLVPNINTTEDENNPSLSPDGSILYFTAYRNGGVTGLDLYSATRCSLYSAAPSPSLRFTCF